MHRSRHSASRSARPRKAREVAPHLARQRPGRKEKACNRTSSVTTCDKNICERQKKNIPRAEQGLRNKLRSDVRFGWSHYFKAMFPFEQTRDAITEKWPRFPIDTSVLLLRGISLESGRTWPSERRCGPESIESAGSDMIRPLMFMTMAFLVVNLYVTGIESLCFYGSRTVMV